MTYAFSPIGLVPDFIPVPAYLDDLVLPPLGIWLSIKLISKDILAEYRAKTKAHLRGRKPNYLIAGLIVLLWILLTYWLYRRYLARID